MRFIIYLLITLFVGFSCSSKSKKKKIESVIVNEQSQPVQKKKKVNKYANLINNQNVIQKLKDFGQSNKETLISIETTYGNIKLKLYDDTPLHRSNFIMLVKKGFYDSTLFYRVIRNFMIQGGNSDDQKMFKRIATIGNYKIPASVSVISKLILYKSSLVIFLKFKLIIIECGNLNLLWIHFLWVVIRHDY